MSLNEVKVYSFQRKYKKRKSFNYKFILLMNNKLLIVIIIVFYVS